MQQQVTCMQVSVHIARQQIPLLRQSAILCSTTSLDMQLKWEGRRVLISSASIRNNANAKCSMKF